MALAAYRHVLRSTRIAFKEDSRLLHAARLQARIGFDKGRQLGSDSEDAVKSVAHAEEVAKLLRHNIVQGETKEGEDVIKLRIHDDIERGDNESILTAGKKKNG